MSIPPFVGLPSGVFRKDVAVRGGTLAILSTGAETAAERVLFVPGYTGSKEDFLALLPALHDAGIHAVAYDQFGQYESRIDGSEERFGLTELAADTSALARVIWPEGPRPHLVGHSLGGLVARAAVLNDPANFGSLTLLSSGPHAVGEHQHPALHGLLALLPDTDLATVWQLKLELERQAGAPQPAADIAEFLQRRWLNNHPLALRAKAQILLSEPDRLNDLANVRMPLAVICGDDDDVWWPDQQHRMSVRLGAHYAVIRNVGHSPAADAPEPTIAALRDFWYSAVDGGTRDAAVNAGTRDSAVEGDTRNPAVDAGTRDPADGGPRQRTATQLGTQSAREARRFIRHMLTAWGVADRVIDDVELITSEMATNALVHGEGPVQTTLIARPTGIRVAVTDCTASQPVLRSVANEFESGRGMMIINTLSTDWGTDTVESGKTVWAEIPVPEDGNNAPDGSDASDHA